MLNQQKYYQSVSPIKLLNSTKLIDQIQTENYKIKMMISNLRSKSFREDDSLFNETDLSKTEVLSDCKSIKREDSRIRVRNKGRDVLDPLKNLKLDLGDLILNPKYTQKNCFRENQQINSIAQKLRSGSNQGLLFSQTRKIIPISTKHQESESQRSEFIQTKKMSIFRIKSRTQDKSIKKNIEEKVMSKRKLYNPQLNQLDVEKVDIRSLTSHISSISHLEANSTPQSIFTFFQSLYSNVKAIQPTEAVIKRYKNCIYYGQKVAKNDQKYTGMVWYFKKILYYGELVDGKKHGQGIQIGIMNDVVIWKGKFHHGHKTGYFSVESANHKYYGSLKNGEYHGQGHLNTKTSQYKGNFCEGEKEGIGFQKFYNKSQYRGQYFNNKFDGQGELKAMNYYYKGLFKQGKIDGHGFERTDQFQYLGNFTMGKKQGKGKLKLKDGVYVECLFENGLIVDDQLQNKQSKSKKMPNYLSKELTALYQESEEGTIENMLSEIDNQHNLLPQMGELSPINSAIFQR